MTLLLLGITIATRKNNPHINFLSRIVLWDKDQVVGIRDKEYGIKDISQGSGDKG